VDQTLNMGVGRSAHPLTQVVLTSLQIDRQTEVCRTFQQKAPNKKIEAGLRSPLRNPASSNDRQKTTELKLVSEFSI
jgi:hypothetical protein